jgi:PAS domain S-box-containing protein
MRKLSRDNSGKKGAGNNVDGAPVITRGADKHTARRKSFEDALRKSPELFLGVFDQAAVGMALTGPDRKVVQANRKVCDFLGYEFEELFGTTLRAATHPDFVPQVDEQIRKLVDGEVESATIESLYVRKDGTSVWGEWTSSLIRDEHGAPKFFISVIQNINDRKRAEAEAKKTKEMLEASQRIAHLGSWELDIAKDKERWSDEAYRIFGLEPQSIQFTGYEFLEYVHPDDRARVKSVLDTSIERHEPYSVEYRLIRPDGTERTVCEYAEIEFDDRGAAVRLVGTIEDITERKRAELALRRTTKQLEEAQRLAHVGHWEWEPDSNRSEWSEELFRIFGLNPMAKPLTSQIFVKSILHKADRPELERAMADTLRTGNPYTTEFRIVRPDGEVRTVLEHGESYVSEETGRPRIRGVLQDITELKQAEGNLREISRRLELAQKQAKVGYWRWSFEEERLTYWSQEAAEISQYPLGAGRKSYEEMLAAIHPNDRPRVEAEFKAADEERRDFSLEYRVVHKEGRITHIREIGEVEYDGSGVPVAHVGFVQDITELKQMEQELRTSEQRLNAFFEEAPAGLALYDKDGRFIKINDTLARLAGIPSEAHVGKRPSEILHTYWARHIEEANRRVLETGVQQVNVELTAPIPTALNEKGHYVFSRFPIPGPEGEWLGVGSVIVDITDRKRVEDELRTREKELSQAQRIGEIGHWRLDVRKREFTYWSDELYRIFGVSKDDFVPTFERFMAAIHDDDLQASIDVREAALAERRPYEFEYRIVRPSGEIRVIWGEARPEFDENGEPTMVFGITQDVTEARQRESELRQAQKMEVVGQLTGGVAHDFNNLLGVIIGNLELAQETLDPGSETRRLLEYVFRAADRGAALTQRLLAFSRKQPLSPQLVKAHELVDDTSGLLRRTLGETVEIEIVSNDDMWACLVDPAQLESAILNLAINARDAMPDGGKLTVETSNAKFDDEYAASQVEVDPGEYVLVAISDSGSGISPEVLEHVFEPFFTTKDIGAGSGLGLSMVYGFIKQSGGHITVYSEVGEGTTIRLYLPRHLGDGEDVSETTQDNELATARNEVVLVVEDDVDLRTLVVNILQSLDYDVLESGTGRGALDILEETLQVDLLLTDVMLPGGMGGQKLAKLARSRNPDLPVLYMSGYTEDAIIHQGRLEKGVHLMQKPFRRKDIAQAVRRVLDGPPT